MFFRRTIRTKFRGCHSITADVTELLKETGITEGYCTVCLPDHATGLGVTSFWDPRGLEDLMDEIDRNFPARVNFENQQPPYDAAGRIKAAVMGDTALFLIQNGKLVLGSSQGLVLIDFDGPQERTYEVNFIAKEVKIEKHGIQTSYMGMIDLTDEIQKSVEKSGILNGICHIAMLHSTAGLLLADRKKEYQEDLMEDIEKMVPTRADFHHRETASDAGGHVKTALTDSQLSLIVKDGRLVLSEEQAVLFAEYDGPRPRNYYTGMICG